MPTKTRPYDAPRGFDCVVEAKDWEVVDDILLVSLLTGSGREAAVRFRAEQPAIWRITFFPPGKPAEEREPLAALPVLTPLALEIEKTSSGLLVRGAEAVLEIRFRPWRMRFLDARGREIFSENPDDVDGLGRSFVLPLGYVRRSGRVVAITETFKLHPDERLFGLGEKFTSLDKSGQRAVSWAQDALGSTSERSHKNVPFLWSTRGFGLFLDTGARITWDLGAASCQSATIHVEDAVLDAYLICAGSPAQILGHYASLTGRAPVPPKWSFGLSLSTGGTARSQDEAQKLVSEIERNEIPVDVFHIDTWWLRNRKYCDFEWDRNAFPRPEILIGVLRRHGLKLSLWEHPYISVESELFAVGKDNRFFVQRPDGEVYVIDYGLSLAPKPDGAIRRAAPGEAWNAPVAVIDLTNPEALAWFKDLHRPLLRQGVDSFKTDFGEDIPADAVFANGKTGAEMHNVYPLLYNRAVFEVIQEEKGQGAVWARSAFAGSQRYPLVWSGDPASNSESLAATIRGGLSAGLSGLPFWSNDIGGYRGIPSAELYVRWAQFGLFCSHSRMHGDSPREPWYFGEEAAAIVRKYALLRYELFPYIYSAAFEAGLKGIPVIRALPLAFPDDLNVFDKDFQYMFGPGILVAPVIEPEGKHRIYLPEGCWYDYWTKEIIVGPKNLRVQVPLDILPLYVCGGAIIPRMQQSWRIPEERIDPLIVEVWPHETSDYLFYEDEGVTEFRCRQDGDGLDFEWSGPLPRRTILHIKSIGTPNKIVMIPREEPDKAYELEGIRLEKTYVLAIPETSGALLTLSF